MTKNKTTLIEEDFRKGTVPRPKMCRPMMCEIQTEQIREEIFYSLVSSGRFPEEQKGFHWATIGKGDLLYIELHILKESKVRRINVFIA